MSVIGIFKSFSKKYQISPTFNEFVFSPTNKAIFNNGSDGKEGYRAHFSHENEVAEPGYYKVYLDTTNIDVELTVSKRSGIHKYEYPSSKNQILIS